MTIRSSLCDTCLADMYHPLLMCGRSMVSRESVEGKSELITKKC
jgi:hypothetical protein